MCDLSDIDNVDDVKMEYITPFDHLWMDVMNDTQFQNQSYFQDENILSFDEEHITSEKTQTPDSSASVSPVLANKFQESGIKITPFKLKVNPIQGSRLESRQENSRDNRSNMFEENKPLYCAPLSKKKRFSKCTKQVLDDWFENNIRNPYPSKEDCAQLTKETGLTSKQLHTYFVNKRVRSKESFKGTWRKCSQKEDIIISLKTLKLMNNIGKQENNENKV